MFIYSLLIKVLNHTFRITRYLIEPRDRIFVKGYGFLSFDKNINKKLSCKYSI